MSNINELNSYSPKLSKSIFELQPHKLQLVKIITKQTILFLALKLSIFKSEKETIHLLSIQDIRNELEQTELETWQKLIRVLKHEISNSISPITSLANTTKKYFLSKETNSPLKLDELNETILHKTVDSLDTIETTGKGLIHFVEKYKSLTDLPQAKFEKFMIGKLFEKIQTLLNQDAYNSKIAIKFYITPLALEMIADFELIEKVLINIIRNAFQALENNSDGKVVVKAYNNIENRIVIEIIDNGPGISSNNINDIFIPFYTTKEKGSGIGLSLSRQIMRLHKGTITVKSIPNKETVFILVL
jgi:signal transduction histidine kinase